MAQKQATKKPAAASKSDAAEQVAIPTAGTGAPSKKLNLAARFMSKAKPATKSVAKKDRPVLQISDELAELIRNYAPTKEIFDVVSARNEREKKEVNDGLWESWIDALWSKKSKPETPAIKVKNDEGVLDVEAMFIVNAGSKIKVDCPPTGEDQQPDEVFVQALVDLGVGQSDAENLVEKEIDFTPLWSLDLTSLMHGKFGSTFAPATAIQRQASEKLFLFLQGCDADGNPLDDASSATLSLDDNERDALQEHINSQVKYSAKLTDGDGFLDRVCQYAHTREQLGAILSMLKPVFYISRVKFAVSDDPTRKAERLIEEAASRLGADVGYQPTDE